jgi:CO/xanthine dehydrogenase Mo-binding subunit
MPCVRCHQSKVTAMKFGIGQPVQRHKDLRLVTGHGRYTDDIILSRRVMGE